MADCSKWARQELRQRVLRVSVRAPCSKAVARECGAEVIGDGPYELQGMVVDVKRLAGEFLLMRKPGVHRPYFDWDVKLEWEVAAGRPGQVRYRDCHQLLLDAGQKAPAHTLSDGVGASGSFKWREIMSEEGASAPCAVKTRHCAPVAAEELALVRHELLERVEHQVLLWVEDLKAYSKRAA